MRKRSILLGFVAGLLAVLAALPAAAVTLEEFSTSGWRGAAFADDASGAFTHCSVFFTQGGATLIVSAQADGSWFVSVADRGVALKPGEKALLALKIDDYSPVTGEGVATGQEQIGLSLPPHHPFIDLLRRGAHLGFAVKDKGVAFDLAGSGDAIAAARDCVARQEGGEARFADDPYRRPSAAFGARQSFGPWVVTATADAGGGFVNCTAFGIFGEDQLILSYFADGTWTFGFNRAGWNLDPKDSYALWSNIDAPADAAGASSRPVVAAGPKRLFVKLGKSDPLIARMQRGGTLNMIVHGERIAPERYSFSLTDTARALAATRRCAIERGVDVAEKPPAVEAAPKDVAPGSAREPVEGSDAALPALGGTLIAPLDVPGWQAAVFGRADDTFTHCAIAAEYRNGATFGVARTAAGDLVLQVADKTFTLSVGARVPFAYSLSGQAGAGKATATGVAVARDMVVARIAGDAAATAALGATTELTVEAAGKTLYFDTHDIGPGIAAIDACVAAHAAR